MMDMSPIGQAILVYSVLAVGVLVTLLTGAAQFREFGAALSGKDGAKAALVRRGFLAASVGMGSIGGTVLAIEIGGPGAVGWMWVASILGMGLIYAEVQLSVRLRAKGGETRTTAILAEGLGGKLGNGLAIVFALGLMTFALVAGSAIQTQQSGELLSLISDHDSRWLVAVFLAGAAGAGALIPKVRTFVAAIGPVAVVLYVFAALLILASQPSSSLGVLGTIVSGMGGGDELAGGAAGGGLLVVMQAGFLRATLATEAGLGSAGFTEQADRIENPESAARAAMLAPLVSGVLVPTVTAMMVLGVSSASYPGLRLDEPGERRAMADGRLATQAELVEIAASLTKGEVAALRDEDKKRTMATWVPLERPQSRGTVGSLQAGQAVVLPEDAVGKGDPSKLERDHVYPMVMRASPRGTAFTLKADGQIILPWAPESAAITEVVYRDKNPEQAKYPAYDRRVAVSQTVAGPEGRQFIRLTPVDPEIDFLRLSKVRDGPYLVYGDYQFDARIARMFHKDWGAHDAIIAAKQEPQRPLSLRTTVPSPSFRGPYLDTGPDTGEARPPMAMIAREDFDAPIGTRLAMEYRGEERGSAVGRLLVSGEYQTPPWRFLTEVEYAILRHNDDPTKDVRLEVTHQFVDGKLRFVSAEPETADFAQADRWRDYSGPFLEIEPYRFEVEVHSGARAPASSAYLSRHGQSRMAFSGPFSGRRTLVPVHPEVEPVGSRGELYDPHPAEVAPFLEGPWVTDTGAGVGRLGWASMDAREGPALMLAISILILALTTMIAWAGYGARATEFVFGEARIGFALVFAFVGLAGAISELLPLLRLADHLMVGLVLLNGLGLVVALVRASRTDDGPTDDPADARRAES